jgi:hypothetical protein
MGELVNLTSSAVPAGASSGPEQAQENQNPQDSVPSIRKEAQRILLIALKSQRFRAVGH